MTKITKKTKNGAANIATKASKHNRVNQTTAKLASVRRSKRANLGRILRDIKTFGGVNVATTKADGRAALKRHARAVADLYKLAAENGLDAKAALELDMRAVSMVAAGTMSATDAKATRNRNKLNAANVALDLAIVAENIQARGTPRPYYQNKELVRMIADATTENADDGRGVFIMTTATDYSHAGKFATAMAAYFFPRGLCLNEAMPYGEGEKDNAGRFPVSWYVAR